MKRLLPLLGLLFAGATFAADIRSGLVVAASSPADADAWASQIEALESNGQLTVATTSKDVDFPGRRHIRYDQRIDGLRVFGVGTRAKFSAALAQIREQAQIKDRPRAIINMTEDNDWYNVGIVAGETITITADVIEYIGPPTGGS